jgi:hypothetical protein
MKILSLLLLAFVSATSFADADLCCCSGFGGGGGGGGGTSIGGTVTNATAGSVLFADTGPILAQDNTNLFWNTSTKSLSVGARVSDGITIPGAARMIAVDGDGTATTSSYGVLKITGSGIDHFDNYGKIWFTETYASGQQKRAGIEARGLTTGGDMGLEIFLAKEYGGTYTKVGTVQTNVTSDFILNAGPGRTKIQAGGTRGLEVTSVDGIVAYQEFYVFSPGSAEAEMILSNDTVGEDNGLHLSIDPTGPAHIDQTTSGQTLSISTVDSAINITSTGLNVTGSNLTLATAGKTLSTKEAAGGADCSGGGTLSSGAATITTSCAASTSRIFVTDTSTGSLAAVGALVVSQKNSGNFHVNSTNVADASTFDWFIVNPN